MGRIKSFIQRFRFKGIFAIASIYGVIAVILFIELSGVQANYVGTVLPMLSKEQIVTKEQASASLKKDTLLLWHSQRIDSVDAKPQFDQILTDMKVGYEICDLDSQEIPPYSEYSVVIVLVSDLFDMGDSFLELCDWVYEGGDAMLALPLENNVYTETIENKIGVRESGEYSYVDQIYPIEGFMIGGGRNFTIPDAYHSARTVRLFPESTTVYAAEGGPDGVPLVWESRYGEGKFVVDNFGLCDKAFRGFYAASLSLLTDVYLYPVINGSTFYLDDFPSQIPDGNNPYIDRDYNTSVRDFYLNIWWPDMLNLADKYGAKYTGLAIESYDNHVDGTTDAEPDKMTFQQMGNMLLRKGGELGYHGYNHQPLALGNKSYDGIYDYKTWDSYDAMKTAFSELIDFCEELFPDVPFSVYVPPSNLMAIEGKQMMMKEFPHIMTYSGIYFEDDALDFSLIQEFDVNADGVVEQPRIISGCDIDDFMKIGALSELNMHLVNDHFTHPDDALDPDRGAELGWEKLKQMFDEYLQWLYGSVPGLRNFSGTELSAAVQRYVAVTPHKEMTDDSMTLKLEHFYDNAQFLVRFNEKTPGEVIGGSLMHVTGNLYLLEAKEAIVTIQLR